MFFVVLRARDVDIFVVGVSDGDRRTWAFGLFGFGFDSRFFLEVYFWFTGSRKESWAFEDDEFKDFDEVGESAQTS